MLPYPYAFITLKISAILQHRYIPTRDLTNVITQPLIANTSGQYSYYAVSGTQVIEKVCSPFNQCQSRAVTVGVFGVTGSATINPANNHFLPQYSSNVVPGNHLAASNIFVDSGGNNISIPGLTSGSCVQTSTGGLLTVTGAPCASGSASISGQATGVLPLATGVAAIGAQSHLDDGVTAANSITSTENVNLPSSIGSAQPLLDIRHPTFGGICDGLTDIGPALQAAWNALPTQGGEIVLVGSPSACRWANPTTFTWGSKIGPVTIYIQGTLSLGTTLTVPNNILVNFVGRSGAYPGPQFTAPGQISNITVDTLTGTFGTAVSIADGSQTVATITPSTMVGLYPGTAITISGVLNCSATTLARTSNIVTATFPSACHIPPGVGVCITGASDGTFNGCHSGASGGGAFLVRSSDYYTNTMTWLNSGSNASGVTGATVQGFNEDTIEDIQITSTTSTTFTATFNRSHQATDKWGVVAFNDNSNSHTGLRKDITFVDNGGTPLWINQTYETNYEGASAVTTGGCGSNMATNVYNPTVDVGTSTWLHFNHVAFDSFCEPWAVHLAQPWNLGYGDAGPVYVDDSFILRGIKMDHGGFGIYWDKSVCDQCARGVVSYDTTNYWNGNTQTITIDHAFSQDNPDGFNSSWVYQLAPGGAYASSMGYTTIGSLGGWISSTTNSYAQTQVIGQRQNVEIVGEGAGFGASIIPYATVGTNSGGATFCTTTSSILAPDGTTTATSLVQNSGGYNTVLGLSVTPAVGDTILFGGWTLNGAYGYASYFVDNNSSSHWTLLNGGSGTYQKLSSNQWDTEDPVWHPVVGIATVATSDGTAGIARMGENCYTSPTMKYWQPFMIYVPASAGVSAAELQRWRTQLLHGVVPAGMPASVTALNPSATLAWGTQAKLSSPSTGLLQTDSNFNIASGKTYQINGTQVASTNLGDFSGTAPTTTGQVPIYDSGTGKYAPGTPAGSGNVTGPGSAVDTDCASFNGASGTLIQDSGIPCTSLTRAVGGVNTTGLTANVSITSAYSIPAGKTGWYQIACYLVVTTAATSSSTLPACSLSWNDGDTGGTTYVTSAGATTVTACSSNTYNVAGTACVGGAYFVHAAQSTNINYLTSGYASSGATQMVYALRVVVVYIGP